MVSRVLRNIGFMFGFLFFVVLLFANLVFAEVLLNQNAKDDLRYLYFQLDDISENNRVAYSFELQGSEYSFVMNYYFEGELQEKTCEKKLSLNEEMDFTKIICEIPKLGNGEYVFYAKIEDSSGGKVLELINKEYVFEGVVSSISFVPKGDLTIVVIDVSGEGENLYVKHRIPKNVISNLNKGNKDDIITTNYEFDILEEDPLIAWNVDRAPAKINYTINRMIAQEDEKDFGVEIVQSTYFQNLKYLIFALIVFILIFLFKPLLKKK